jgi:NitT/TauT family transport system substrate-binding protein
MAGGFLLKHGLKHAYAVLAPGETAAGMIRQGKTDVMQSAPSTNWAKMEKGETGFPFHFALINRRDGFFLVSRQKEAAFEWRELEGKAVIADHGSQPLTMLRYAVDHNGAAWRKINFINAGGPEQMMAAFRAGEGDYIHVQAPLPQLLEEEGMGWTAASVGASMPPNAFSSLCASKDFIETDACRAFAKAFAEAKEWVRTAPAAEIAAVEAPYFPGITQSALASAIGRYQSMGAWEGGVGIPRDLYEQSLNVFEHSGAIRRRQPYDSVCVSPA